MTTLFVLMLFSLSWGQDNTISKKEWIDYMQEALPKAFCDDKQYFRQCFKVMKQECMNTARAATRMCLNSKAAEIPEILVQPRDGSHWSSKVGECAGDAYENAIIDKRINSAKCNDPKNWV